MHKSLFRSIATVLALPGLAALIAVGEASSAGPSSQLPGARANGQIPRVYSEENTGARFPAPTFPDFDRLPIVRPLPDPFRFFDGTRSTAFGEWERRRNEISGSIQKWEIGQKPDASDLQITADYTPPSANAAGRLVVTIRRPSNGTTVTLSSKAWLPEGNGPFPVFIPMTGGPGTSTSGPSYGQLASVLSSRPIATVEFVHNQVTANGGAGDKSKDPFYVMYPEFAPPAGAKPNDHGQYAAWSWGVSRLIDGIMLATRQATNRLPVNPSAIAVSGCSYAGKMALFAGAFDERVALTMPIESGGGGAPAWRVMQEIEGNREVESLANTNYQWFSTARMRQFSQNNVYKLPHDHHELGAMVAPRALLWTGNTDYRWLGNRPNYVSSRAVQKTYETLGIGDRFGFVIDGGHGHCAIPPSQVPVFGAFVDKFLLGVENADTNVRTHPYGGGLDPERFTAWWGTEKPSFPRSWDAGDGKVVQQVNRTLTIPDGGTVRAGFSVSLPSPHPEASVTMVGGSVQLDILNSDGRSYVLTIPFTNNIGHVIPENFTGWIPSSFENVPPAFVGTAKADVGGTVTNVVFSALGANLTTGAGNAAGPGIFTSAKSPVNVRFHVDTGTSEGGGNWSTTVTVPKVGP